MYLGVILKPYRFRLIIINIYSRRRRGPKITMKRESIIFRMKTILAPCPHRSSKFNFSLSKLEYTQIHTNYSFSHPSNLRLCSELSLYKLLTNCCGRLHYYCVIVIRILVHNLCTVVDHSRSWPLHLFSLHIMSTEKLTVRKIFQKI